MSLQDRLKAQIETLECVLLDLKQQLSHAEVSLSSDHGASRTPDKAHNHEASDTASNGYKEPAHDSKPAPEPTWEPIHDHFHSDDYARYGRQMILPQFGLDGQIRLSQLRVLIVGAGGLGCPAAMYLGAAGIGHMHIMDGDQVELSNLHRQIAHDSHRVGWNKAVSIVDTLKHINPRLHTKAYPFHMSSEWALQHMRYENYDLVLDCTDRPETRYLISDAAVAGRVPLISAAALRTDGQLLVLNFPPAASDDDIAAGSCYRCVFPRPPPAASTPSCSEAGVLGPVVGTMGTLMAVEALKMFAFSPKHSSNGRLNSDNHANTMLIYSMQASPPFRSIRIKGKRPDCLTCANTPARLRQMWTAAPPDYTVFCGSSSPANWISADQRISARALQHMHIAERSSMSKPSSTLVDVRPPSEYAICHLPSAINIPLSDLRRDPGRLLRPFWHSDTKDDGTSLVFICRFGNDSQEAVALARGLDLGPAGNAGVVDVRGGLRAWREECDSRFPEY